MSMSSDELNRAVNGYFTDIPEEVSERINNAKSVSRKKEILGGYILLDKALKSNKMSIENEQIKYEKKGKPYIDKIQFNISHSADFIALVFGKNQCGIDIMNVTHFKENICEKYFTVKETDIVKNSSKPDEIFTLNWCLKEAYFKMTGEGITRATKEVDFSELLTLKVPFEKEIYGTYFYCDKIKENYVCVCLKEKENIEVKYE